VLFSASRVPDHSFLPFWLHRNARAVLSDYVVIENERHIVGEDHRRRFDDLLRRSEVVIGEDVSLPADIDLPAKDRPILAHAIAARARYLVTGDRTHFGRYFDQPLGTPSGPLTIVSPRTMLALLDAIG
jgi:predicted nucleic acid-binding protein